MRTAAILLGAVSLYAQNLGTIDGRVTNSVTGEGVPDVRARFLSKGYVYEASTDSSGSYHVTGLANGDYNPQFIKDGFSQNTRDRVHVGGGTPATFNLQMRPWATLRGRVVDENGDPIAGVRVEIGRGINDDVSTNAAGEFVFHEITAGSYILAVKPPTKVRLQDGVRFGSVTTYYPSGTDPSQAAPIVVRTGQDVSGVEVRLKNVPVHRISGVVLTPGGMPASNATVKLLGRAGGMRQWLSTTLVMTVRPTDVRPDVLAFARSGPGLGLDIAATPSMTTLGPNPEPVVAQVESAKDGSFEFAAVEAGEWRVSAVADLYEGMPLGNVVSASVGQKDVEDLQIRLAAPIALRGAARFDGPNPPKLLGGAPDLAPMEGQEQVYFTQASLPGKRPGNLPGRYRVMPESAIQMDGLYVASILWQGRDVTGQVIELGPGAEPFELVYKNGLGSVSGKVDTRDGALVLLIPRAQREITEVRSVQCNPDGAFALGNVPEGDYGIVALERGELSQVQWNLLDSVVLPMTTSVHLDSGGSVSVNPRASPWPW